MVSWPLSCTAEAYACLYSDRFPEQCFSGVNYSTSRRSMSSRNLGHPRLSVSSQSFDVACRMVELRHAQDKAGDET